MARGALEHNYIHVHGGEEVYANSRSAGTKSKATVRKLAEHDERGTGTIRSNKKAQASVPMMFVVSNTLSGVQTLRSSV